MNNTMPFSPFWLPLCWVCLPSLLLLLIDYLLYQSWDRRILLLAVMMATLLLTGSSLLWLLLR